MNQPQYDCDHGVYLEYNVAQRRFEVMHGDNPEARLYITDLTLARARNQQFGFRRVQRWLREIHKREEVSLEGA